MEKNIIETSLGNQEVFSKNLLRFLQRAGISQAELSRRVGVSTGTLNDWVKGRCYPKMDKIQLLADILEVQKSDLIEPEDKEKIVLSEEDKKIIELFHRVPKEKRAFVLSMIRSAIYNL